MTAILCVVCGAETPDGYACVTERDRARRQLLGDERDPDKPGIIDLVEPARAIAYRLTRRGSGANKGKPGSAILLGLRTSEALRQVEEHLTKWAKRIARERHNTTWVAMPGEPAAQAAAWLAIHGEWCRHKPWIDDYLKDVHACHRILAGIADPSADTRVIVGRCDCGKALYAWPGQKTTKCADCDLEWDVDDSHETLREDVHERLVTAAEAAHLAGYLDTDRTGQQIRKLVNKWAERDQLEPRDGREVLIKHRHRDTCRPDCTQSADLLAVYRFGDIADRLANTPRRAA